MFKRTTITFRIPLAMLLALATVRAASATPEGRLVAMTEMAVENGAVYEGSDPIEVRFTLHNDSLDKVQVLVWHTPLAGFSNDLFYVERDGEPVPYTGRLVKWGTPTPEDYVEIESGGFLSTTFDPSAVYDMSEPGHYTIRYRDELLELNAPHRHAPPVKGAPGFKIDNVDVVATDLLLVQLNVFHKGTKGGGGEPQTLPPAFVACTNERQATLLQALATAAHMSNESRAYLQNLPNGSRPSDARYDEWFGTYDAANYSTVTTNFVAIESAFTTRTVSFHCDCELPFYAFVYPTKPYEIHLCKAFWIAAMTGTDSK
ncbi:MAG: M35 family metallo-endopeptidase, partial [Acidobacteriota bacterium]|nr:M35 family metallo-endopeptidase [Acidobacteriota bacterium]